MSTKSESSLKVFLRNTKREMSVVVWQLVGYHGKEWSVAQVAWPGAVGIQVREQFRFYVSSKPPVGTGFNRYSILLIFRDPFRIF